MNEKPNLYTSEERILSAISHAAIIVPYLGLLAPLGVWITQREKSAWLRFQALQALVYQSLQFIFMIIASCLILPVWFSSSLLWVDEPVKFFPSTMIFAFLPYLIWGLVILIGLLGGLFCALGKDFKYPLLGKRLGNYLENTPQEPVTGGEND